MAGKEVKVSVTAETAKFQRAFRRLVRESGIDDLKGKLVGLGKSVAVLGGALATGTVALGVGLSKFGADLEQSRGAIQDVFKSSAAEAEQYSRNAARSVGLTGNAYNELATIIGSQLKNAGTPMQDLAGKTNDLIKTGADLAAMFGGTTQDAVNALSSALKGERDPIERYGVSLKQATIDAKAAALGFEKVDGAFSQEAQTAATLALIMEQTADAHGKFAREGDTMAHQAQVWTAILGDAGERIGAALLPPLTAASAALLEHFGPSIESGVTYLTTEGIPALQAFAGSLAEKWIPALKTAAEWISVNLVPALIQIGRTLFNDVIPAIGQVVGFLIENGDIVLAVGGLLTSLIAIWNGYIKALELWKLAQLAATAAQAAWNAVMAANPIVWVLAAIAALVAALYLLYTRSETARAYMDALWAGIKEAAGIVAEWFTTTAAPKLLQAWEVIKEGAAVVATWLTDVFVPTVLDIWENIKGAAAALWDYMTAVWTLIGQPLFDTIVNVIYALAENWDSIWAGIKVTFQGVWDIIQGVFKIATEALNGALKIFTRLFRGDWDGAWQAAKDTFWGIWDGIKLILKGALEVLAGTISAALNAIYSIFVGIWRTIVDYLGGVWDSLTRSIKDGFWGVVDYVRSIPRRILNALGDLGSLLWNAGTAMMQGFIDSIGAAFGAVRDTFYNLTSWIPEWKGPESLDRVLLKGPARLIMSGFVDEIQRHYGDVKNAMSGVTQAVEGGLELPAVNLPVASARHGGHTINVYTLAPSIEVGRLIAESLGAYQRANGVRA